MFNHKKRSKDTKMYLRCMRNGCKIMGLTASILNVAYQISLFTYTQNEVFINHQGVPCSDTDRRTRELGQKHVHL